MYKVQLPAQGTQPYWEESSIASTQPLQAREEGDTILVTGANLEIAYDKARGGLRSCKVGGTALFTQCQDRFYRALTGIDEGQGDNSYGQNWRAAGLHNLRPQVESVQLTQAPAAVILQERLSYCGGRLKTQRAYWITAAGVKITTRVANGLAWRPCPASARASAWTAPLRTCAGTAAGPRSAMPIGRAAPLWASTPRRWGRCTSTTSAPASAAAGRTPAGWKSPMRPARPAGDRRGLFHFSALPWTLEQYDACGLPRPAGGEPGGGAHP